MKRISKLLLPLLVTLSVMLGGVVSARASIDGDIGVCWWEKNKAHEGAEAARALGCTDEYVLKWFGNKWTEANNRQKELEAQLPKEQLIDQGTWTITAYCNDGHSASGRANIPGQTCACNCLPFGTVIRVEGMGDFIVTDIGASTGQWAWHNSNWCDLYLGSEPECTAWGVQKRQVWVVK